MGHYGQQMLALLVAAFPLVLLALMLGMERIERQLGDHASAVHTPTTQPVPATEITTTSDELWRSTRRRSLTAEQLSRPA
jgi:hypothetical protein